MKYKRCPVFVDGKACGLPLTRSDQGLRTIHFSHLRMRPRASLILPAGAETVSRRDKEADV